MYEGSRFEDMNEALNNLFVDDVNEALNTAFIECRKNEEVAVC
jgi:hypothetical protein